LPPEFFLDRNLGTRIVPGLLRDGGWNVTTLSDVYGEHHGQSIADDEWLEYAGRRGLTVLMKDKRIRYRSNELEALIRHKVVAFCLAQGTLDGPTQARVFLSHRRRIEALSETARPTLYMVSRSAVRRCEI